MKSTYPAAALTTPGALAKGLIWTVSSVVFLAVVVLNRVQVPAPEGFDVHVFAKANAVINTMVSVLLLAGLLTAKAGKWDMHRKVMLSAMVLSVLFLVSYILHHLFAGETKFGGQGTVRIVYYVILFTHIVLAATSLPFILFTAFRALKADFPAHKALARRVWPVWFYVSVTGVVVYFLISPYY